MAGEDKKNPLLETENLGIESAITDVPTLSKPLRNSLFSCSTVSATLAHSLLADNGSLKPLVIQVLLNTVRDFTWTFLSYESLNLYLHQTDNAHYDTSGQWLGQQLWATGAMLMMGLGIAVLSCCRSRNLPAKDIAIYTAAAATAIYTWDRGQQIGINCGKRQLSLSSQGAAYFSAIFTGIFEGPTQYALIALSKVISDSEERKKYMDVKKACIKLFKDISYSASVGAVPGAVWQIMYAACLQAGIGPVATGIVVMLCVAFANTLVDITYESCFEPVKQQDSKYSDIDGSSFDFSDNNSIFVKVKGSGETDSVDLNVRDQEEDSAPLPLAM